MPKYPPQPLVVCYDSRGTRARKHFTDAYAARRFYAAKFKAGKNPKLRAARDDERGGDAGRG